MGFKKYLISRSVQIAVTLFVSFAIAYAIMRAAPGDPITAFYGMRAGIDFDPEVLATLRHQLGLDKPVFIHFLEWFVQVLHGDLGHSFAFQAPVAELVGRAAIATLKLQGISIVLGILIAVPVGVIAAVKQFSKADYVARFFGVFFWSMPWFWLGLMMILLFSLNLDWFPTGGAISDTAAGARFGQGTVLDQLWHLALPVFVIALGHAGFLSRIVRSTMLEVLRQEYILTARSKGLKERVVIFKHAFRNAMMPVVTVIGMQIGYMFGGAATVETVFSYPGMGKLIVEASFVRDYPTMMGTLLITSTVVLLAVFITDITYAFLDPRIRY